MRPTLVVTVAAVLLMAPGAAAQAPIDQFAINAAGEEKRGSVVLRENRNYVIELSGTASWNFTGETRVVDPVYCFQNCGGSAPSFDSHGFQWGYADTAGPIVEGGWCCKPTEDWIEPDPVFQENHVYRLEFTSLRDGYFFARTNVTGDQRSGTFTVRIFEGSATGTPPSRLVRKSEAVPVPKGATSASVTVALPQDPSGYLIALSEAKQRVRLADRTLKVFNWCILVSPSSELAASVDEVLAKFQRTGKLDKSGHAANACARVAAAAARQALAAGEGRRAARAAGGGSECFAGAVPITLSGRRPVPSSSLPAPRLSLGCGVEGNEVSMYASSGRAPLRSLVGPRLSVTVAGPDAKSAEISSG